MLTMAVALLAAEPAAGAKPGAVILLAELWEKKPSRWDWARAYPKAAHRARVKGCAIIVCQVAEGGGMGACKVVKETPEGHGFGAAALSLAPKFKLPATLPGQKTSAGGTVRIPLNFGERCDTGPAPLLPERAAAN